MKQLQIKKWGNIFLSITLLLIAHLKDIPLFWFPRWLNDLYYNNGFMIYCMAGCMTIILLCMWGKKTLINILCCLMFVVMLSLHGYISDIKYKLIMRVNISRDIHEFYSPFVGFKVNYKQNSVTFISERLFMTEDVLVYGEHNLNSLNRNEMDASIKKIYDNHWVLMCQD
ncbi:MAG: hypothetical protein LBS55_10310 [Prevotellaceae bacterium]|nr:hypothetical protein [Prevotellaceae bacterium]